MITFCTSRPFFIASFLGHGMICLEHAIIHHGQLNLHSTQRYSAILFVRILDNMVIWAKGFHYLKGFSSPILRVNQEKSLSSKLHSFSIQPRLIKETVLRTLCCHCCYNVAQCCLNTALSKECFTVFSPYPYSSTYIIS